MSRLAVVNYSPTAYNLATSKMVHKFEEDGHTVQFNTVVDAWMRTGESRPDRAYLSAIFTWDLKEMVRGATDLLVSGVPVEMGGPAVTAMPEYVTEQMDQAGKYLAAATCFPVPEYKIIRGLDPRWEHIKGNFQATFTSRGCPRACEFCLVNKLEGRKMIEYDEFNLPVGKNPYICDNNLLSTSWHHQCVVVEACRHIRNLDINSGFDDRIFIKSPDKYWELYRQLKLECWRFAYDSADQKEAITGIARYLTGKGVDYRHIIVFCLAGGPGTSFAESRQRLQYLIDIGCSPYPMRYRPLLSLEMTYTPPGWNPKWLDLLFSYYGVPYIWRKCKWEQHLLNKQNEGKINNKELGELLCQ